MRARSPGTFSLGLRREDVPSGISRVSTSRTRFEFTFKSTRLSVLLATGVVKAKDPEKDLRGLVKGLR